MAQHYLLDGFNVLYALAEMPAGSWEEKRQALIDYLRTHRPQGRNPLTLVFDSRQGQGDRQSEGDIDIVYTAGESADDWISHKVREVANPRILIVVTNDQGLTRMIRGTGAKIISADEFLKAPRTHAQKPGRRPAREDLDDITEEMKKEWLE